MGMLLLWCAACIILPIIKGEGIVAVFFPYLIRRPQVRTSHLLLVDRKLAKWVDSVCFESTDWIQLMVL